MPFEITKSVDQLKIEASARIDALAGGTRLKYITSTPGQEATYTAKLADARAYIADAYPSDSSPYVWVDTEANATQKTPTEIADVIVATAQLWNIVGAEIEGARMAAKQALAVAKSIVEIRAAERQFNESMSALSMAN